VKLWTKIVVGNGGRRMVAHWQLSNLRARMKGASYLITTWLGIASVRAIRN
jgi:hypothetical protein